MALLPAAASAVDTPAPAALASPARVTGSATPARSAERVADTIAERTIACASCHGRERRAPDNPDEAYYPRIAGKPAGYLYNQLLNFRQGRRRNPMMAYLVDALSDAYLQEMAAYFAGLHPLYATAASPAPVAPGAADTLSARGRTLVQSGDPARRIPACVACHGNALTGRLPAIPGLLGLPRDYMNAQLGAWKSGSRHTVAPDCMATIAQRLTTDDIAAASTWLAAQPFQASEITVNAADQPTKLPLPCGSQPE